MVTVSYLASALVTGLLLLVVVVGVARWPEWRGAAAGAGGGAARQGTGVGRGPAVAAVAAVLLLALVVALLAPGLAGGGAEPAGDAGVPGGAAIVAVGAGLGLLTVTYLVWGVYHSTRYRGLTSAQAAGVGAWVFGLLVIVAVLAVLLLG